MKKLAEIISDLTPFMVPKLLVDLHCFARKDVKYVYNLKSYSYVQLFHIFFSTSLSLYSFSDFFFFLRLSKNWNILKSEIGKD